MNGASVLIAALWAITVTPQQAPQFDPTLTTNGDSFVKLRNANVLHMGDCYLVNSYPVIDSTNGGSYVGTISAAKAAIDLADERSRIIPGHGPISNERELRDWHDMLVAILDRIKGAVKGGKSLDAVRAKRPTRDWDEKVPNSFVTSDHVIEEAYRDIERGRAEGR